MQVEIVSNPSPFFTQINNLNFGSWNWSNTCSCSCMAMMLKKHGIVGAGQYSLDDEIAEDFHSRGLQRGAPMEMKQYMQERLNVLGKTANFTSQGTVEWMRDLLRDGHTLIVHTWLTRSGHLILLKGFDDSFYGGRGAWEANDPFGEWHAWGYDTSVSGESQFYSYNGAGAKFGTDRDIWMHWVTE